MLVQYARARRGFDDMAARTDSIPGGMIGDVPETGVQVGAGVGMDLVSDALDGAAYAGGYLDEDEEVC